MHPNEQWMQQIARNVTMDGCPSGLSPSFHDRDAKYSAAFCSIIEAAHFKILVLSAQSPNLRLGGTMDQIS